MSICLIDTSVFVTLIGVPGMAANKKAIASAFKTHVKRNVEMLLPLATIFETGNHIAQHGNGNQRRACGLHFVGVIRDTLNGNAPWTALKPMERESWNAVLESFPNLVCRSKNPSKGEGISFGDATIIEEFIRLCHRFPKREIFIWSNDMDMQSYHQPAAF